MPCFPDRDTGGQIVEEWATRRPCEGGGGQSGGSARADLYFRLEPVG
jgi:hypothetical protein